MIRFRERTAAELPEFVVYLIATEGDDSYWSRHQQSLFVCAVANRKRGGQGPKGLQTSPLSSYTSFDKESDDAAGSRHRSPQATRQQTRRERHTANTLAAQCG